MEATMTDKLTTIERNFLEHWARRRMALLRSSVLTGAAVWGGMMSAFELWDEHQRGSLTLRHAALIVALTLVGGVVFGAALWGVGEIRYRRLKARS